MKYKYDRELGKVVEISGTKHNGFKKFFDWSLGKQINSLDDIKAIEKKGQIFTTVREVEELKKKKEKWREELHLKQIEKGIKNILIDGNQGRKFSMENREHRERCLAEMRRN